MRALRISVLVVLGLIQPAGASAANPRGDSGLEQCQAIGLTRCPRPFDAVLPQPADMLSWDRQSRVVGFRNTYRLYAGDVFHTLGATTYPLPSALNKLSQLRYEMDGERLGLDDYLRRQNVTGLLVLSKGRVVYEYYGAGNTDKTLWTSRSVAKSVVSILIGMAIKEGLIGSVVDPITRYLPELRGSDWEGVTLRDLLQHVSGVSWNEHYADPLSDFAHLTICEAGPAPYDCVLQLIRALKRPAAVRPGERWSYNTAGAWLAGRVLEKASGTTLAHYLQTRLWSRYAMQDDGVWQALVPGQVDMGGHGLNATLRDWGRFALFVAGGGKLASGEPLLPPDWIAQSVTWTRASGSVTPATPDGQYGYQWWYGGVDPGRRGAELVARTARKSFWALGIYGQAIAIDPADHLVMVQWSTWENAETPAALYDEQVLLFDAIARTVGHPH